TDWTRPHGARISSSAKLGELFDEDSPRLHPEGAGAESGLTLHARQRPLIHWRSKRDEIQTDAPRRDRRPAQPSEAGACSASRLAARTHHRHPADLPQRRAGPGGMVEGVGAEDSIERTIID